MLSLLLDIKNNRQRGGGGGAVTLTAATQKWLKSVGSAAVALHSLPWDKLLAPDKKVRFANLVHFGLDQLIHGAGAGLLAV